MKVISLKEHRYASRIRPIGAQYEIKSESDRRLMFALGRVQKAPAGVVQATEVSRETPPVETAEVRTKRAYVRRNLTAEVPVVSDAVPQTYLTRDLTAE